VVDGLNGEVGVLGVLCDAESIIDPIQPRFSPSACSKLSFIADGIRDGLISASSISHKVSALVRPSLGSAFKLGEFPPVLPGSSFAN
jgi:hypothetical protein